MEKQEFINNINERLNNGQNAYLRFNKDVDFHTVVKYTRIFKKEFPNTYIDRYKYEGQWTIVFYAGDYETQKFLNKPIKMLNF